MKIVLIYFSPTNSTHTILKKIAEGFGFDEIEEINLTKKVNREKKWSISSDLCLIGAPCYEARIPLIIGETFQNLEGNHTPTVAVILYGNRTLGISLKQLVSFSNKQNFDVIGTGTFIGEHSYAGKALPLALNRPDGEDLNYAQKFGRDLKNLGLNLKKFEKVDISGKIKFPFNLLPEGFISSFGKASKIDEEKCTRCQICVKKCPTKAIDPNSLKINRKICIRCMACVKFCPENARIVEFRMKKIVDKFMAPGIKKRRKPRYEIAPGLRTK